MRTLSQLRITASLKEVDAITLLSVTEHVVPDSEMRALTKSFSDLGATEKLRVVPPIFHPIHLFDFKRYVARVGALRVAGVPYLAGKWDSTALRNRLRRVLRDAAAHVVYIDHLGMARYLRDIKGERPFCRTILDQHNVESDFFKQFAEEKKGVKKIVAAAEYRAARKFEERALRQVDAVVAISGADAKRFHSLAGVRAHIVPLAISFERKKHLRPSKPHFCYVGSLRWKPNVVGLDWFCREVWPLVRKRVPDATFEIAGIGLKRDERGCLPVPDSWKMPGIQTLGFLEDLEPLYARSLAMLAPISGGSGVRVKLLDGFRAGIPIVTTPDAAAGLPLEDGIQALIAADPAGFAERAERLVADESLRERLREGGYAFIQEHHSLGVAQRVMRGALGIG
jgi:glycosyltransferase involved in cell wall biosynthesis